MDSFETCVQVSIGHSIVENENRVTGRSNSPRSKNGDFGVTSDRGIHMQLLGETLLP